MRIGIDGSCWLNRRGYGRFARALINHLVALDRGAEYTLVIDFDPAQAPAFPAGLEVLRIASRQPAAHAASASGRRSLADMWAISRAMSRARFDVRFFPSAYTYVPVTGPGRTVVVIHDVIAERFPGHVFPTRLAAARWWLKLWAARHQADLIMTVSQASRTGISERFRIPADGIVVLPEAADPLFRPLPRDENMEAVLQRFALRDCRFVLYVGGISPHKNLGALVEVWAHLRREPATADVRLVLVGDYSDDVFLSAYGQLRQSVERLGLGDTVRFTGYVADADLLFLYSAAQACVLPSLLEGCGLPAIEAMACGAPVVASCRGALPEVVGAAALLFDPDRPGDLGAVLRRVLTDAAVRDRLRQLGPLRAAQFSWERAARIAFAAFCRLTQRPCEAQ